MPRLKQHIGATARRPWGQDKWVPPSYAIDGCGTELDIKPKNDGRVVIGAMTPCLGCGGAEQALRMLVQYTDHSRLDWVGVWVVNPSIIDPALGDAIRQSAPIVSGWDAAVKMMNTCDVVYTWGMRDTGNWFTGKKAKRVLCSHGSDETFTADAVSDAASADVLVAVADSAVYPFPDSERARVKIIWNAAETDRVKPRSSRSETRATWGVDDSHVVYGAHTRFSKEKEVYRMVTALPYLPDNYRLCLAGWGMLDVELKRLAAELGQSSKLIMPGTTYDVGGFLISLDKYLSTSPSEGCSLALNEALVAGTPAISTQTGLLKSRPELARLLPASPSGEQIAAAILGDDDAAERALVSKQYASSFLTEELYGKEWTELLLQVAGAAQNG